MTKDELRKKAHSIVDLAKAVLEGVDKEDYDSAWDAAQDLQHESGMMVDDLEQM